MHPVQSWRDGCGLLPVLCMQAGRDGLRAPGIRQGATGTACRQAGTGRVTAVPAGVCQLPGEELGAESQASAGWSPAEACQVG